MNELKPEDVMRALECHYKEWHIPTDGMRHCDDCPYNSVDHCSVDLVKDALALLREKDAEIERLKAHNRELDNLCDLLHKKLDEGYAEFANEERAEAITEFAEKLIAKKCHYTETEHTFDFDGVTVEDIEQTSKEMREEQE